MKAYRNWKEKKGPYAEVDQIRFIDYYRTKSNNKAYIHYFTDKTGSYKGEKWLCRVKGTNKFETFIFKVLADREHDINVGWEYTKVSDAIKDVNVNSLVDRPEDWDEYLKNIRYSVFTSGFKRRLPNLQLLKQEELDYHKTVAIKKLIIDTDSPQEKIFLKAYLKFITEPTNKTMKNYLVYKGKFRELRKIILSNTKERFEKQ